MSLLKNVPKHATPTKNGWIDPKTGELLIAVTGLVEKLKKELEEVNLKIKAKEAAGETSD